MIRRLIGLATALMLLGALTAAGVWEGRIVDEYTVPLASGAALRSNTWWTGEDYRTEYYLELKRDSALKPSVYSFDTLCARDGLPAVSEALAERGIHTVAAVNGGFFTYPALIPVGIVVRDGILRSWDAGGGWMSAMGFRADGSALMEKFDIEVTLSANGEALPLLGINQSLAGLTLYTEDFGEKTAVRKGWNLICAPEGNLTLNGTVTLTAETLRSDKTALLIPQGRWVLSVPGDPEKEEAPAWLTALTAGTALQLETRCGENWADVDSAVGILYPLVENGQVLPDLDTDAAPRTAAGLRADGSLILYALDGRQKGYSVGAGLDELAERMAALGCVTAGALDGGGSTNLSAVCPGDRNLSQINRPSDGEARLVVNYILLTTDAVPTGVPSALSISPFEIDAVPGAEIELSARAIDANGYPVALPEDTVFSVSDGFGRVENGVFHALAPGRGTVTATASGVAAAEIPVTVTEPDAIALYGEVYGRHVTKLTLEPGQEVDLTVRAWADHVLLTGTDQCYTWSLEPEAGEVDDTGHLIPAPVSGAGTLTVSCGDAKETAAITIWSGVPFRDILTDDPLFPAVRYVYDHELFSGVDEVTFDPDTEMNRAMLVTVLWRMNGQPQARTRPDYADVAADDWFGPAVAWATENGLVNGYGPDRFGPLDTLTRQQIITILHRYAGAPEATGQDWEKHPDAGETAEYAVTALQWATDPERDILPMEDGWVLPDAPMTRGAVAETLMRFLESRDL